MAWEKGKSGNPAGGVKEKRFYSALERAVLADDGKLLRAAAEKLLENAAKGEPWAINTLADRLDGKAAQSIDMNVKREARDYSMGELLERLAELRGRAIAGAAGAEASASGPRELH